MEENSLIEQRLNPLTGIAEWVVIEDTGADYEEPQVRSGGRGGSLAHTQYLDMLNDVSRNRAYNEAIRKVVKANDHVLDIGAGTGLLSMMAWRAMAEASHALTEVDGTSVVPNMPNSVSKSKITACESYLPMVRLARKLLRANGVGHDVRLLHTRSDEIKIGVDMPSTADVLVSEILDSELLGEGLIPTLRHAQSQLLSPNARMVPHRATVHGQLVECNYLWRCHDLAGVEADLHDGIVLAGVESREEASSGSSDTLHVDGLADQLKLMSEPFEIFKFEFRKMQAEFGTSEVDISIIQAGVVHALVSWWVLYLDEDGLITYSTAPKWIGTGETTWRDHWKQCVWTFPGRGMTVVPGDRVRITAMHDAVSIRYEMRYLIGDREKLDSKILTKRGSSNYVSLGRKSRRIGLLGDGSYRRLIKGALTRAVQAESTPLCLVVDDSIICVLTTALANPKAQVVALLPGLKRTGSKYLNRVAAENGVSNGQIQVMGTAPAELSLDDFKGRKGKKIMLVSGEFQTDPRRKMKPKNIQVDILIAEPYYNACEDLLPWRHLRFWHERSVLTPLLASHPKIIPCKGILRCVAVCLPDLWHSRKALTSIEGFDFSTINQSLGACGEVSTPMEEPLLPYSLWQCGYYQILTEPVSIMEFDFSLPLDAVEGSETVPVSRSGTCHAVVLWMDWVMDSEKDLICSTGPSGPNYWKQGIKLLPFPLQLLSSQAGETGRADILSSNDKSNSSITISAYFSPHTGEISVDVSMKS